MSSRRQYNMPPTEDTTEALLEGYEAVLYAVPIETESTGDGGPRTGTGLLKLTEIPGLEPSQWPYEARPAYAAWRWLVDRFEGVDSADIERMSGLPVNAKGARVSAHCAARCDTAAETSLSVAPGDDLCGRPSGAFLE